MPVSKRLMTRAMEHNQYAATRVEICLGKTPLDYASFSEAAYKLGDLFTSEGKCMDDFIAPVSPRHPLYQTKKCLTDAFKKDKQKLAQAQALLAELRCNLQRDSNTLKTLSPSPESKKLRESGESNDSDSQRQQWIKIEAENYKKAKSPQEQAELEAALVSRIDEDTCKRTPYLSFKTLQCVSMMLGSAQYTKVSTRSAGRMGGVKVTRVILDGHVSQKVTLQCLKAIAKRASLPYIDRMMVHELKAVPGKRLLLRGKAEIEFLKSYSLWLHKHKEMEKDDAQTKREAYQKKYKECTAEGASEYWKALAPAFRSAGGDTDVQELVSLLKGSWEDLPDDLTNEESVEIHLREMQNNLDTTAVQDDDDEDDDPMAPAKLFKKSRSSEATSKKPSLSTEAASASDKLLSDDDDDDEDLNKDDDDGADHVTNASLYELLDGTEALDDTIDPLHIRKYGHIVVEACITFIEDTCLQEEAAVADPKAILIVKYVISKLMAFDMCEQAFDCEALCDTMQEMNGSPSMIIPYFCQKMKYRCKSHEEAVALYCDKNNESSNLFLSKLPSYMVSTRKCSDALQQKKIDEALAEYKTFQCQNPQDQREKNLFRSCKSFLSREVNLNFRDQINHLSNHENYHKCAARLFPIMDGKTISSVKAAWEKQKSKELAQA